MGGMEMSGGSGGGDGPSMNYGFYPQSSWRKCVVDGSNNKNSNNSTARPEWLVCLTTEGEAHSVCPLESASSSSSASSLATDASMLPFSESNTFWGAPFLMETCFPCPSSSSHPHSFYGTSCTSSVENVTNLFQLSDESAAELLDVCSSLCESGNDGEYCSGEEGEGCLAHSHFCNFDQEFDETYHFEEEDVVLNSNLTAVTTTKTKKYKKSGTCQSCPSNIDDCYHPSFGLVSEEARQACVVACEPQCDDFGSSELLLIEIGSGHSGSENNSAIDQNEIEAEDESNTTGDNSSRNNIINVVSTQIIPSDYVHLAIQNPHLAATAPIVQCSQIWRNPNIMTCEGAKGNICFIEVPITDIKYWKLSKKAQMNGCVGIILSFENVSTENGNGSVSCGYNFYDTLNIPMVCVGKEDGQRIKDVMVHNHNGILTTGGGFDDPEHNHTKASLQVSIEGQACHRTSPRGITCSDALPCPSSSTFCPYDKTIAKLENVNGWCQSCPVDSQGNPTPLSCYFELTKGVPRDAKYIEDCVKSCDAQITYKNCKFCPNNLNALNFGIDDPADKCIFCPNYDLKYPDRLVPLFGDDVKCWQMQTFFDFTDVHKNTQNCALAQQMNYICGCEGVGYAGANSHAKQEVLVWMPRVMAILSIFGSSFILYDTIRTRQKRRKMLNQMLFMLSVFDIFGSIAYAFTTLPTPQEDYLHGAKGNDKTCKAQGFFIQIGTIACFMNVSISVYYLLTIKYGWKDGRLLTKRPWFFIPPIVVGLVFAFVGIPYYDNLYLWCNNSARYWPEIPVILAILIATVIMIIICLNVRKTTRASAQYASRRNSVHISTMVFEQACWFTGAFYITWVPYLAMQYMWSSGQAFTKYGFILYAASTVPLQGFWNFVVYARPRYFNAGLRSSMILSRVARPLTALRSSIARRSASQETIDEFVRRASLVSLGRSFKKDSQDVPSRKESSDFVHRKDSSDLASRRDSPDNLASSMGRVAKSSQAGDIIGAVTLPESSGIDDTVSSTHQVTFSESNP